MAQNSQVIELLTDTNGSLIHSEAITAAASAVIPGDLVELTASGELQGHSTSDGTAQKLVALTNLCTAGTIDKQYSAGETARYGAAHSGQESYMWLATSQVATLLTPLSSNGDGSLKVATVSDATLAGSIVAYPLEAVTTTGSKLRIKVRIF